VSEILFVTWDGGGNVPPALGIATELAARGHTVRFLGHARQREAVTAAGFAFTSGPRTRDFSALDSHSPVALVAAFGDRGMGQDLLDEVAARPADVVVVDCLLFGPMDAARRAGLRYVVLEHLYDAYFRRGWLRGPMGLGMRLKRLRPQAALAGAELTLVASLPSLDPSGAAPAAELTYVGPVVPATAPAPREAGAVPTVLVSLSTYWFAGMTGCLQRVLDACAGLDARVVVTTGPVVDPDELRAPDNAEVHRFVPHADLMPSASLVIGHGGHGTTMQALAHDLPLVVMPMHPMLDQPLVGRSVEQAGAGRVVAKKASAEQLAPVVAELLADGPHRAAAARLGAEIRAMPGATIGADRIEGLLRRERPAPERGRRAAPR